ncbi:DUF1178 family protein [Aurantiacibacter marinus]|uniref:Uncharacterized protein n=1 Tax=Aurantiacibacter marinus TaxID=874156 RepID=A0A0H0XMX3_9SPHN|nr:DUF1178 family protein [Aurantiacibacter marinus]KLI63938.1 hypothetical protein AAV99_09620 [Aurantiacibacter marinus]
MIVFDLSCANGHRFEGWFGSSDQFASQQADGLLMCPACGTPDVAKAPMAPSVGRKGNSASSHPELPLAQQGAETGASRPVSNAPMPAEVAKALAKLADAQAKALKDSKWVGRGFAEQSRAMHYGEQEHAPIHGETSPAEAQELVEEGVPVAPLPFPVAPPEKLN